MFEMKVKIRNFSLVFSFFPNFFKLRTSHYQHNLTDLKVEICIMSALTKPIFLQGYTVFLLKNILLKITGFLRGFMLKTYPLITCTF